MSIMVTDGRSGVIPARFDEAAFDRERERIAAAQATLAEARELVEQFEKQRPDIEADMQRRTELARFSAAPQEWRRDPSRGLADDVSPPADCDRTFPIETIGSVLAEMMEAVEVMDKRIDRLEQDLLLARGLLHEHSLAVRSLLPDPHDLLSAKMPLVLARAGSRHPKERATNRSWPATDSVPWFSQPFFNDDDD
jgi:hypothetical protein